MNRVSVAICVIGALMGETVVSAQTLLLRDPAVPDGTRGVRRLKK